MEPVEKDSRPRGLSPWTWPLLAAGGLTAFFAFMIRPISFPDIHIRIMNSTGREMRFVTLTLEPAQGSTIRLERALLGNGEHVDVQVVDGDCRVNIHWRDGEGTRVCSHLVDPLTGDRVKLEITPTADIRSSMQ